MDDKEREDLEKLREALGLPDKPIGNMFGWKISFIGLFVILFFMGLIAFRYWQIGYFDDDRTTEEILNEQELEQADPPTIDSLKTPYD